MAKDKTEMAKDKTESLSETDQALADATARAENAERAAADAEAKLAAEKANKGIPSAAKAVLPAKPAKQVVTEKGLLEQELRCYVKQSGGFRKGLSADQHERAKRVMFLLGRKEPKWDIDIAV